MTLRRRRLAYDFRLHPPGLPPLRNLPLWGGAAGIVWSGTHLWVSDGDNSGSNFLPGSSSLGVPPYAGGSTVDTRTRYVRVIDTSTNPPTLVHSVDLQEFRPFSNVLSLRLSTNGPYVMVCIRANEYIPGLTFQPGRVLFVDKTTFQIVGNAEMSTGPIGDGSSASGARDCVEDTSGNLYVTNSNTSTHNIVEIFNMDTVITGGTTPKFSYDVIECPDHAEELCFDGTYVWTSGWNYSTKIQRIDTDLHTVSACNDSLGRNIFGITYALGHLWALDGNRHLLRINPAAFIPGGTANMVPEIVTFPNNGGWSAKNSITDDGTNLWVANEAAMAGVSQVWKVQATPGSMAILATVPIQTPGDDISGFCGLFKLAFDGSAVWGTNRIRQASGTSVPGNQPSTIARIITTPGSEAQDFQWAGPTRALWVGDKNGPILTKLDTTDPLNPVILTQIDLSAYGQGIKRVKVAPKSQLVNPAAFGPDENNHNLVFVGMFPTGAQATFVIVDASTNAIVGSAVVSTGLEANYPVDFAFGFQDGTLGDGGLDDGFVYVLAQNFSSGTSFIYKYVWQEILDAFPADYASPVAHIAVGTHLESLSFGGHMTSPGMTANFLWGTKSFGTGMVYRITTDLSSTTTYTATTGHYFSSLFAFGSLWVTGASSVNENKVFRFDPAAFPSDPTVIVVDPGDTISNTSEMAADNSTIWVANGSNFVDALPNLFRVSTGLGTETLLSTLTVPGVDSATNGLAFDGVTMWVTLRHGTGPSVRGVASFSTGGVPAFLARSNPGLTFDDPVSIAVQ